MAYKQQPKSPVLKALKGNQGKLPQHLQDAIKAAPESPAKQTKRVNPSSLEKKTVNSARQMLKKSGVNNPNLTDAEVIKAAKGKGVYAEARSQAKQGLRKSATSFEYGSPAKQTTAGEFAHKKSIKDKEMGKSTKVVDKFTSALEAPFSDKTYSELKKEKRAKQKAKYNAKSPAKQTTDPKTPVGPKAEKPKTKKEVFIKKVNKKRYK